MKGDFVEFKYAWPVVLAGSIGISLECRHFLSTPSGFLPSL